MRTAPFTEIKFGAFYGLEFPDGGSQADVTGAPHLIVSHPLQAEDDLPMAFLFTKFPWDIKIQAVS